MRSEGVTTLKSHFIGHPLPKVKEMAKSYYPQHSWQSFQDPLPEQTHFWSLHNLPIYTTLHFDHIEEIKHNGNSYPREVDSCKHQGSSITLFFIESIEVGQLQPEKSIVGHIDDKCHQQEYQYSDYLYIMYSKEIPQNGCFVCKKDLTLTDKQNCTKQPKHQSDNFVQQRSYLTIPHSFDLTGLRDQRSQLGATLLSRSDIFIEDSLFDIVRQSFLLSSATRYCPLHQSVMLD